MKRSAEEEVELNAQSHKKKVIQISAKLTEGTYGGPSLTWFDRLVHVEILREMDWSALMRMRQTCWFFKIAIDQLSILDVAYARGFQRLVKMCVPVYNLDYADEECMGHTVGVCLCHVGPTNPRMRGHQPSSSRRVGVPQRRLAFCGLSMIRPKTPHSLATIAQVMPGPLNMCPCRGNGFVLPFDKFGAQWISYQMKHYELTIQWSVRGLVKYGFLQFSIQYDELSKDTRINMMMGVFVYGGWPLFYHIVSMGKVHPKIIEDALEKINLKFQI